MSAFTDELNALLIEYSAEVAPSSADALAIRYIKSILENTAIKAAETPYPNSYQYPETLITADLAGIEKPIEDIRSELQLIPWLRYCFGRAWEFSEKNQANGRTVKVPKIYTGKSEYLNVMPCDMWQAFSFIMCDGPEEWQEFTKGLSNPKRRKLNVFVWFNLENIIGIDGIATESLKRDVEAVLKMNQYVSSINSYVDEKAGDVFSGYVHEGNEDSQYLMYPYSGFRFNITVNYFDNC